MIHELMQQEAITVECGVWKGGCSLAIMLTQRIYFGSVLNPVYLFDSFEGLPEANMQQSWQQQESPFFV